MNSPHNVTRNGCNRSFVTMSPFDRPIAAPISTQAAPPAAGHPRAHPQYRQQTTGHADHRSDG